jgi:hypothetical protein
LLNASGKLAWTTAMEISNSNMDYKLALPTGINKGMYTLQLLNDGWMYTQNIVIAQ